MRNVETPRDEPCDGVLRGYRRRDVFVRSEEGDTDGARVEPLRMRAYDVAVGTAEPPLVDRPEAVDEKVVADVVPAVPLHVEELDSLHDRSRFRPRIAVAASGVVDDRETDRCRVARRARGESSRPHPTTSAARSAESRLQPALAAG